MERVPLDIDELVERWTLLDGERELVAGKRDATRLGFVLLLKYYTQFGRFPRGRAELPAEVVEFVAGQVSVPAAELGFYEWTGSTIEYHRSQVRAHLGFRECSVAGAEKLTEWLADTVCEQTRRADQVQVELLAKCRAEQIEPPSAGRVERMVRSALRTSERTLTLRVSSRLTAETEGRLEALVAHDADDVDGGLESGADASGGATLLSMIKQAPGNVSLDTMLAEIDKLVAVRAVGLPAGLFDNVAPKVVEGWRARAAIEAPSHLRDHPRALRLTLLAGLLHARERELTDTLVDLLIATVHRVSARAETRVTEELVNAFRRVSGKENILFKVAEASLGAPDGTVRQVVFPAVTGGEATLRGLVHEFKRVSSWLCKRGSGGLDVGG